MKKTHFNDLQYKILHIKGDWKADFGRRYHILAYKTK